MVTVREYVVELSTRFNQASARATKTTLGAIEATAEGAREATTLLGRAFRNTAKESAALTEKATATKRTIDETRDAARRLGAQQKILANQTSELRAQRTTLNKDLKSLQETIRKQGRATQEQARKEKGLERALKGVETELEKTTKQARELTSAKRKLGSEVDRLTADYNGLKRAAGDAARAQDGLLRRAGRGAGRLAGRGARAAGRGVRAGARVAGRAGLAAGTLGASELVRGGGGALGALGLTPQTAALAAVGAALTKSTKAAIEFESSFADVVKVLGKSDESDPDDIGLDGEQLGKLQQDIIDLSTRDIPIAAEGISNIVAAAGQAGIGGKLLEAGDVEGARQEIIQFTESAAKVGVAFDISAEEAGTSLAKLRTGLGLSQSEVEGLAGTINVLSNALPATAAQILDVEKRIGSFAQSAGVSKEATAGLAAALVGAGAPSNIAATAVKNLTLSLAKGSSASDRQKKALGELGLTAEQAARQLQEDGAGLIERTFTRISEFSPDQQTGLLSDLFGSESAGAISPLLENLDLLRQGFDLAADSEKAAGSVQAEFESRSKTTANQLQLLKNRVTAVGISVGNKLLPEINDFLGSLDEGKFEGFGAAAVSTITAIKDGVIAVRDAIAPFYEGLAKATSNNLPKFGEAGKSAVDALLRLFSSLSDLLDTITGQTEKGESGLRRLGELAGGAVLGAFELLSGVVSSVADGITAVSDGLKSIASGEVTKGLRDLGNSLVAFVVDPLRAIVKQVIKLAEAVGAGGAVPDALREFAGGVSAAEAVRRTVAREQETQAESEARKSEEQQQRDSSNRRRQAAEKRDADAVEKRRRRDLVDDLERLARGRGRKAKAARDALPAALEAAGLDVPSVGDKDRGNNNRGKKKTASPFEGLSSEIRGVLDPEFKSGRVADSRRKKAKTSDLDVLTKGVIDASKGSRIGGGRDISSGRSAGAGPTVFQTIVNVNQENSIDARGQPAEVVPAIQRSAQAVATNGADLITGITKGVAFLKNQAGRRTV